MALRLRVKKKNKAPMKHKITYRYSKQLLRFFDHAKQQGLELLQDDKYWIADVCDGQTEQYVRELLMPYISTWKKYMRMETHEHKKQNAGRHMANSELREKV